MTKNDPRPTPQDIHQALEQRHAERAQRAAEMDENLRQFNEQKPKGKPK